MGTRYEDQPVEQWAGPESLDPTPVWKQYILVALLLIVGLAVVVAISVTALAPQFATPPALVVGDRLVLAASDLPPVGGSRQVAAPIIDDARSFYLVQPEKGRVLALRDQWSGSDGSVCHLTTPPAATHQPFAAIGCLIRDIQRGQPLFDLHGESTNGYRALDQYLVSVSGDRIIVNLSRVIQASERTSGPVPTGIPQPQTQQP
jgi:hypothetical protein